MITIEKQQCTHDLCIMGTRTYDAKFKVTQVHVNGGLTHTYTCLNRMRVMGEILSQRDVVRPL